MASPVSIPAAVAAHTPEVKRFDRGRIPSLDGLRAVAVLLVLVAHGCQTAGFPKIPWIQWFGVRCAFGVEVFFVISGFLITSLLLRERQRSGRIDVKGFYVRRTLRILPAYACYLAVIWVMWMAGGATLGRRDWIAACTYTMNFLSHPAWEVGHTWSLSIEEHFYLIWPVAMLIGSAFALRAGVFFAVGCFVLRWVVMFVAPKYTPMAELWTFTRLDTISFGCLLALLTWHAPWRSALDRLCAIRWIVPAGVFGLLVSVFGLSVSALRGGDRLHV
jgi:peptidoglycan/LPS O-acetylase OafA/YrhL